MNFLKRKNFNKLHITSILFPLTLTLALNSCGLFKKSKKKSKSRVNSANSTSTKKNEKITLKPLWQKELHYLVIPRSSDDTLLYAVSFKGFRKRPKPFMNIGIDKLTGTVKWTKKRSFRKLKSKDPYSIVTAMTDGGIYYLSKHRYVYTLAKDTGSVGNGRFKADAGFAVSKDLMFVGANPPYVYNLSDGTKKFITGIKPVKKGIPVKTARSFPVQIFGDIAIYRTTDGALRGADIKAAKELWNFYDRYDSGKWPATVPTARNTALIPIIYPAYIPETIISFITDEGNEVKITLPGRLKKRSTVINSGNYSTVFTSSGKGTYYMTTLNLNSGKVMYSNEVPTDRCTSAGGFIICRNGKTLTVTETITGKMSYTLNFAKKIRFVSGAGNYVALEFTNGKVSILNPATKKVLWSGKHSLKGTGAKLVKMLYGNGDKIALLLKTEWKTKPRLNRLYLKIFSLAVSDSAGYFKLGKPVNPRRHGRTGDITGTVIQNTPVWQKDGIIYSVADGLFQYFNVDTLKKGPISYTIPGKTDNELSLTALRNGIALVERGDYLSAIGPNKRLLWSKKIIGTEFVFACSNAVFYRSFDEWTAYDLKTGKKLKNPFKPEDFSKVYSCRNGAIYLTAHNGKQKSKYMYKNGKLTKIKIIPDTFKYLGNKEANVFYANKKPDTKGVWYALNIRTGKTIWKQPFSGEPGDLGKASAIGQIKPFIPEFFPPEWIASAKTGFLIPGPAHKCIYMISPENGTVIWTRCFHRLGTPPVSSADGDTIYLPATPPYGEPGKPLKGNPPEGEGRLFLFTINAKSGKTELLYEPPSPNSVLLQTFPVINDEIYLTLYEEKKKIKKCILSAFKISTAKHDTSRK